MNTSIIKQPCAQELAFSEELLKKLDLNIFVVDEDAMVLRSNKPKESKLQAVEESVRFCLNSELCQRKLTADSDLIDPDDDGKCCCSLRKAIIRAINEAYETKDYIISRERILDGRLDKYYYNINIKPIETCHGTKALVIVEDITENEKNRLALEEKNRQIQKLNDAYLEEQRLARNVQRAILPSKSYSAKGYFIDYRYYPLGNLCGDMFDYFSIDEDKIAVMIVDVMGHGTAPALITTLLKGIIQSSGKLMFQPAKLAKYLNLQLLKVFDDAYLTLIYGIVDSQTDEFHFVRCGHPKPWVIKGNGGIEIGMHDNMMLGVDKSAIFIEESIQLSKGERLILYTDGLIDTGKRNSGYEGEIVKIVIDNAAKDTQSLMNALSTNIEGRLSFATHLDDICVLSIEKLELE